MANYSTVVAEFTLVKDGREILPPKALSDLILETSADEGWMNDDGSYLLFGRWSYFNNMVYSEMRNVIKWLRQYDYDHMVLDFYEVEEGEQIVNITKALYIPEGNNETKLEIHSSGYMFDQLNDQIGIDYPDIDDYEDDEGNYDDDGYNAAQEAAMESLYAYLDRVVFEEKYTNFTGVEVKGIIA